MAGFFAAAKMPFSTLVIVSERTSGHGRAETFMRIIINGVGIAGPTLAYCMRKAGHEVVLVEAAPRLRSGGYVIDFGLVGYDIAEKMGLIPRLRELGYQVRELRLVDRRGRTSASMSVDSLARLTHGRFITLRRSDLAAAIYDSLDGT